MKKRIFLIPLIALLCNCGSRTDNVIIENVAGITHVRNPKSGLWREQRVSMTLDTLLIIGIGAADEPV